MKLTESQSRALLEKHGIYVTEACDTLTESEPRSRRTSEAQAVDIYPTAAADLIPGRSRTRA